MLKEGTDFEHDHFVTVLSINIIVQLAVGGDTNRGGRSGNKQYTLIMNILRLVFEKKYSILNAQYSIFK